MHGSPTRPGGSLLTPPSGSARNSPQLPGPADRRATPPSGPRPLARPRGGDTHAQLARAASRFRPRAAGCCGSREAGRQRWRRRAACRGPGRGEGRGAGPRRTELGREASGPGKAPSGPRGDLWCGTPGAAAASGRAPVDPPSRRAGPAAEAAPSVRLGSAGECRGADDARRRHPNSSPWAVQPAPAPEREVTGLEVQERPGQDRGRRDNREQ